MTITVHIEHTRFYFSHNSLQRAWPTLTIGAKLYPAELSSNKDVLSV